MSKPARTRMFGLPLIFIGVAVVTVCANVGTPSVRGNPKADQIKFIKVGYDKEPIEILNIETASQRSIRLGEQFDAQGDWLAGLRIKFKNVSGRTLTYLRIGISLRAPGAIRFVAGDYLAFGNSNSADEVKRDETRSLAPGGIAEITLTPQGLVNIKHLLGGTLDAQPIEAAQIGISTILFADGSRWSGGGYSRPDPRDPTKFIHEPAE